MIGKVRAPIRAEFQGSHTLLKYWRDAASHGGPANISDNEALTSLNILLRFAMSVNDNWDDLTAGD